ncbi:dihydrolipoyllysine-residue succinyltransferase [Blattabacterium cuenoti]|uniref:dihydrolipoyllysine-residue succinyltransferase n=1 Tax=Blattabacterium cuenoti TaxID=1653831 RepID=UPI00163C4C42|nr:dihydrolipoyllysine-residue succinyltransferase [Blattabacterium cuenoti]
MIIEIKAPSPGESITEVEISSWLVNNGDYVKKGQLIAEIDSDKATLEIHSENNGIINILYKKNTKILVGDTICLIDTNTKNKIKKIVSPASKKILRENNLFKEKIKGTGKNGRITKKDCINYNQISNINNVLLTNNNDNKIRKECITPLSSLRKKLSQRLVDVKNNSAILTTFNEVNMQEIFHIRKKYKNIFKEKHGVKLGFMSFFTLSCIRALKLYPDVNSMIDDQNNKISFNYFDISIAMSGPKGLVVPVIRDCQKLSFMEIEKEIKILSEKVKNGTITIHDMEGGTFTITNGGVFGSMLSTPIINPPQSAILGMHKIMDRVIVINNSIKICPIMYVALSYDHRIIDGRESVGFLSCIKESIENPIEFLMNGNEKNIPSILKIL